MADIINLRQARKAKRRREDTASADEKRLLHGRTKAERRLTEAERERETRQHDGARRDHSGDSPIRDGN